MDGDEDLARAAAHGDRNSFAALMMRHQGRIQRLVSRYVGNDASDVTQETFISAWTSIARFDPTQEFGVWLKTIAINKSRDFLRRKAVRRLISADFSEAPIEVRDVEGLDPETTTGDRQSLARLNWAISILPANLKDALILTTLEGLSQTEAGAVLGVSAKTIETRVYRARKKLADTLNLSVD